MFRRTPSRVDRGRRVAVDFVVCFGCGGFFRDFFFRVFFSFERTRPAASMSPPCLICLSTSHEARPKERSDRGRFLLIGRKPLHTGVRTGFRYLISLSVCLSVSVCVVCVTFVVFTDCGSCTRPISTNSGSMEACEYGLTRGTCFLARRLEVVAIAGLLWISWCILGGADFFVFFYFRFFFLRTHTAYCKYEAPLPHLPLYE